MASLNTVKHPDLKRPQGALAVPKNKKNQDSIQNSISDDLKTLYAIRDNHQIWSNPLLLACQAKQLTIDDFRYLFSQYYLYSKNFTKLLAATMVNCDSDYYRSMLSANLWEEGGSQKIEKRHSEIFRQFLTKQLNLKLEDIQFQPYTEHFFNQYLDLCLNTNPIVSTAALSFGTEGIVSRLYAIFSKGLKAVGLNDEALTFFHLHMECDDEHAATLEEMTLSYRHENDWLSRCKEGIKQALDLRDEFFNNIYKSLQTYKLSKLTERVSHFNITNTDKSVNLHSTIQQVDNQLYSNTDKTKNINFTVHRVPFETDVLDPRIVNIPQGHCNEYHLHAHETIFLILEGEGEVIVDSRKIVINPGDLIFVPRWKKHQTRNTGKTELKFFAVTDYGLTKLFPQNSETIYREKSQNVTADLTIKKKG